MPHAFDTDAEAAGLCAYVDASPSPFHACAQAAARLERAGFQRLSETDGWPAGPGRHYLLRGGSLVAWSTEYADGPATPFRVVGAHTDSPNLRVKPLPDTAASGWQLLGVEVYGAALLNSWLDRDLGLSGRVAVREPGGGIGHRLVQVDDPLVRVPQLAVHLDREVNDGLRLNPQQHLRPVWGLGDAPGDFRAFLAKTCESDPDAIMGWDLMTHDVTPSRRIGRDRDLLAAPRLDNLATCYAGVRALESAVVTPPAAPWVPVLVLFDHEEVGSMSERGALSTLLPSVLERVVRAGGGERDAYLRAVAGSVVASGDMAHATHPNYPERHDPQHPVRVNGGPVLKTNAKLRYATDALGAAAFVAACEQAGVPVQQFVSRSDMPCGSTVGPITAASTGATTVDFGAATLSMHSAREMCGAHDPAMYAGALAAFLSPTARAEQS